ncbi:MAG TPA: penicillin acylase family protein [Terriglobales bacterium]|nr:penicillin acylase family protein [Terriglobales bacterium]
MRRLTVVLVPLLAFLSYAQPSGLEQKARDSLSVVSGRLRAAGLKEPVEVLRDRWAVAHIYARNQHDLFFAQGFVAAEDRLFQMELWKRSGQGRLAEVLGPPALLRDVNARLLRYRGDMKAEYESYSPDTREILEAFTAGINAYIASRADHPPLEFEVAGFRPEPWKPEDCLNRMAAFSMTGNSFEELAYAQAVATVGQGKASRLFDFDPPVALDPAGLDFSGLTPQLLRNLVGSDTRIEFPAYALEGSNNWTVSGALTASGKPLLANDPHRVIAVPSLRYIVHLVAPGWDVIGAGEPGLPGVALGHNQHIAWGFTIFGLDQQDLYVEQLNPSDPAEYKTEHGWEKMRIEKETFAIRGGPPVTADLKFTRHGPVLWEDGRRALALRWVGAEPGAAGYLGSLAVDRAGNWQEFERAMPGWKVPSENIVYADDQGNIGEHSIGLSPLRKNWNGLLPVPGAGGFEWTGFVPSSELPHFFNPGAGFVATANHRMIPENYPYKVGYKWAPPFRAERITSVLSEARDSGHKLDAGDMGRLQNDIVSLPAQQLVERLQKAAGDPGDASTRMLAQWDKAVTRESAAAALYEVWVGELTTAVIHRVAPRSLWSLLEVDWNPATVLHVLSNPEAFGMNASDTPRLLTESLKTATARMNQLEGSDPGAWSWGRLHTVKFRHALDQATEAKPLVNLGPVPRPGDEYTVNATGYWGGSFEQVSGASYREILDTSDWDQSLAVNTPGQSGQPGSPHYPDLLPLWDQGQYFPLSYSREAVERATTDRLTLEP